MKSSITDYFDLKDQNEKLAEENQRLREIIENSTDAFQTIDSLDILEKKSVYFLPAKVINNNFSKSKNQLTLNKGSNDSVYIDMGVIAPKGIVGIVSHTSGNFSSVQSVLNTRSQIVAKFQKTNHFGTLVWDAKDPHIVQLKEIPRIAPLQRGDTIVTDGKSTIFPEGIPIGTVVDFSIAPDSDYYQIDIRLFTDMTSVKHVYLVRRNKAEEIKSLEMEANDVE